MHANTISKGDTNNQTPAFGGTFKALSAVIDKAGHVTTLSDHTVTLPMPDASGTTLNNYTYTYTDAANTTFDDAITSSDSLLTAIQKLQWQIDNHSNAIDKVQGFATSGSGTYIKQLGLSGNTLTATLSAFDTDVNSAILSAYTTSNISGAVTNSDSLVNAIAKLQVQINAANSANGVTAFTVTGSGNNVSAIGLSGSTITATLSNLSSGLLTGFTQGSTTTAIAASDTLGEALSKLQANITAMQGDTYVFSSVENNYAKIFRQEAAPTGTLKSGWIWIQTSTGYVYFYTGSAWELLNSWQ